MFPVPAATDDSQRDFELPQREAAFFYGLFLRGHSAEELRRDIEVPPAILAKWHREAEREPGLRSVFERIVEYRRHVLAIFEALVGYDARIHRLQEPLLFTLLFNFRFVHCLYHLFFLCPLELLYRITSF